MPGIPDRMKHLDIDPRGYPIPWTVFRDNDGRPHFTVNDEMKRIQCLEKDLCPICKGPLLRGRWFFGGPASAFHPDGAYMDPPLHHECMTYAAQVCPYLANPSYLKRIDAKTIDPDKIGGNRVFIDPTQIPTRPSFFVGVMAIGQTISNGYVKPKRPYRALEIWRNGNRITEKDATIEIRYMREK
jgi:hypothetical protein